MSKPLRILVSRTDAIGDVILSLPLAGILKADDPACYIGFMGKSYTQSIIECCSAVDCFVDVADFLKVDNRTIQKEWDVIIHVFPRKDIALKAKKAGIKLRIGTRNRLYHLFTCNKLVALSRRNSVLHEAQLNTKLLEPLGIRKAWKLDELSGLIHFDTISELSMKWKALLQPGKKHIILHPKSQGSAREWGLGNFSQLIRILPKNQYQVFISGTAKEREAMDPLFEAVGDQVTDLTGQMNLNEFIAFINACDALVAASTGPLHIAAALGKVAIGLYPPIRPMHPGRWAPIGPHAQALVLEKDCEDCRKAPQACTCIQSIGAIEVLSVLEAMERS